MALSIKNREADRLVRELAATTGESLTEAVLKAVKQRFDRERSRASLPRVRDELRTIRERCSRLPVLDNRTPEEIVGYNGKGLPH